MDALQQDIALETFTVMEAIIKRTVGSFVAKYKFANFYMDYIGEANISFLRTLYTHDGTTDLTKRVRRRIWTRLQDIHRSMARRHRLCPREYPDLNEVTRPSSTFDLEEFKIGLSEDAIMVLDVLFDEVNQPVICKRLEKSKTLILRQTLKHKGWREEDIGEVFKEISEKLLGGT